MKESYMHKKHTNNRWKTDELILKQNLKFYKKFNFSSAKYDGSSISFANFF